MSFASISSRALEKDVLDKAAADLRGLGADGQGRQPDQVLPVQLHGGPEEAHRGLVGGSVHAEQVGKELQFERLNCCVSFVCNRSLKEMLLQLHANLTLQRISH